MPTFEDFFDAYSPHHRDAYRTLENTGSWPEGFIPDNVELGPTWHVMALSKLAQAWLSYTSAVDPSRS